MKISKNIIMLLAFICIGLFGSVVYASDITTTPATVKSETATTVKSETATTVKSETATTVKSETATTVKSETTPSVKPETTPTVKPETVTNVQVETVTKVDTEVEMIVSEDKYVRITQPTKVNTSTFESKMNIMGETKQDTEITIEVYHTALDKNSSSPLKNVSTYNLKTVSITESFSQLVELKEGENKIVLIYSNEKDKKSKEKMIFYIIRESEEKKEIIKNFNVFQSSIRIMK